jgi:hypothetical protein
VDLKLFLFNLVFVLLAVAVGRRFSTRPESQKLSVIRTVVVVMILFDLSIIPYRAFTNGSFRLDDDLSTVLPVFFCDIMMVVALVTFCGPRVIQSLVPVVGWGSELGGVFVLVDPTFYNPDEFFFDYTQFRSIFTHCLLLTLFAFLLSSAYFRPQLKHMLNILIYFGALIVYGLVINSLWSFSVMARQDPGFQLNALYLQAPPVAIRIAVGPVIALFLFLLLFLASFLIELARKEGQHSVFRYYRGHPGGFFKKTVDYFLLDRAATDQPGGDERAQPLSLSPSMAGNR